MAREKAVIQMLTLVSAIIGEKAFSKAWTSFLKSIDEETEPIPIVPIDENYREDDEKEEDEVMDCLIEGHKPFCAKEECVNCHFKYMGDNRPSYCTHCGNEKGEEM